MSFFKVSSRLAVITSLAFFLACSRPGNVNTGQSHPATSAANTNSARTNVEELGLLVKVPYEAEDIVWKEFPAAKKVVAVLRFSPADSKRIVLEAESFGGSEIATIAVETWFPEELTAQGETSGDGALRGHAYPANAFFQEPYALGRITRIDGTDFFILEVTAR